MKLNHPIVIAAAVIAGIALILLAVGYRAEPAGSLPAWIPGHEAGSGHHHVKHGIASFLLGVALLVFAWFQTGKRQSADAGAA
jgi:ammonia channel protein AmtB